ncbi:putative membrane protein [Clostridium bornimense]|uniref:Putative membrane protein n=1 Tax=Clostridium bornimense TaxID=1216932 RepID=W6RTA1_9CLOT|nr:VWA domain-containing protein [Clostridium bornimense]CDM67488.1 putative membrane protein [Clostridium bornimense]
MTIGTLWPLILLILVPLVIALYILKRKYKEKEVSSLLLWQEVYKNTHASTPWEKLRKNIMLPLQLIIILLIILALMKMHLNIGGSTYKNVIVVMDTTGSMAINSKGKSRLENGKELIKEYISSSSDDTRAYIISYDGNENLLLNDSSDKSTIYNTIDNIRQSYSTGDVSSAMSFVKAIKNGIGEESEVIVVTDKEVSFGEVKGKVIAVGNEGENASIDNIAHKYSDGNLKVIATVTNRGANDYSGDFTLYNDDNMVEVKNVELGSGEKIVLNFNLENYNGTLLKGELSKKDDLIEDNVFYDVVRDTENKKILLVTEENIFLEKSFSALQNIELFKTNDFSNISDDDKYDLYIFDNVTPDKLPTTGNILFVNPKSNEFFNVIEGGEVKEAKVVEEQVSKYINDLQFTLAEFNGIEVPYYGKVFLEVEDTAVGFYGEKDNRGIAALSFDIHNSDVALKKQFPILIYELGEKLISNGLSNKSNYNSGEEIEVKASNLSKEVKVAYPGEKSKTLALNEKINSKYNLGIYNIEEVLESDSRNEMISVNFPSEEESNANLEYLGEVGESDSIDGLKKGINLDFILIILALGVISTEWILYLKGN